MEVNLDLTLVSSSSDRADMGHEVAHLYSGPIHVPRDTEHHAEGTLKSSLQSVPRNHSSSLTAPQPQSQGWGQPSRCSPLPLCQWHVATALHPQDSPSRWQLHPSVCPGCPRSQEEVTQTLALSLQETVPCLKKKTKLYHRSYGTKLPGIKANPSSAH